MTRKRPSFATLIARFNSRSRSKAAICWSFRMDHTTSCTSVALSTLLPMGCDSPCSLIFTGAPALKNRSEASFSTINCR
ncbi:hypothetical protein D3C83_64670 [compost metagenome]